jgi:hypothetical protein
MSWIAMVGILLHGVEGNKAAIHVVETGMAPAVVSVRKVSGNRRSE